MATKRQVEIFSAGCPVCKETIDLVNEMACPSCEISILDMQDQAVADRAQTLGISSIPAVAVDGQLVDCCVGRGVDKDSLRRSGIGQPLS
jgi:glutaredoxin 3